TEASGRRGGRSGPTSARGCEGPHAGKAWPPALPKYANKSIRWADCLGQGLSPRVPFGRQEHLGPGASMGLPITPRPAPLLTLEASPISRGARERNRRYSAPFGH